MSDIKIRDIVESDIENGFLESLDSLKPASNLDRNNKGSVLAKAIIKWEIKSAKEDDTSSGFLPNLSESFPRIGDTKNCIKENVEI